MGLNLRYWEWGKRDEPSPEMRHRYDQWSQMFTFNGQSYPYGLTFSMGNETAEEYASTFAGYVSAAYQSNGPVFACSLARLSLFSEARFQ